MAMNARPALHNTHPTHTPYQPFITRDRPTRQHHLHSTHLNKPMAAWHFLPMVIGTALLLIIVPIVSDQMQRFRDIKACEEERARTKAEENNAGPRILKEKKVKHFTIGSYIRLGAIISGALLLLILYALLIAYFLAWFIARHTEARVHNARRDLVHGGGEMRLCLCSRA